MPDSKAMTIDPVAVDAQATRQARRRPGLAAITAAAFSGAAFVSNDQADASRAMAVLSGVALLCYLANLLMVGPTAVTSPTAGIKE